MKQIEKTPLAVWAGALSNEICNQIIEEGSLLIEEQATINQDKSIDPSIRDNKIAWFDEGSWVDNLLLSYVFKTNTINDWNFNLNQSEQVQFTKYQKGEFYTWHRDSNIESDIQRKLSVTVQLSDYSDYEGGEFEIKDCWGTRVANMHPNAKTQGSIIVFPSFLLHQVTPVTSGTRYSLVQWYSGPPFV